jgi:hypothetical protein
MHTPTQASCPYCHIIEAPWLVNGAHGASLTQASCSQVADARRGLADGEPPGLGHREQQLARERARRAPAHYCNIIEAPWLVNGGHGASLSPAYLPQKMWPQIRQWWRRRSRLNLSPHSEHASPGVRVFPDSQHTLLRRRGW